MSDTRSMTSSQLWSPASITQSEPRDAGPARLSTAPSPLTCRSSYPGTLCISPDNDWNSYFVTTLVSPRISSPDIRSSYVSIPKHGEKLSSGDLFEFSDLEDGDFWNEDVYGWRGCGSQTSASSTGPFLKGEIRQPKRGLTSKVFDKLHDRVAQMALSFRRTIWPRKGR